MANPTGKGGFKPGYDERRKILTTADRKRGFANAPSRIRARVRGLYKSGKWKTRNETVYTQFNDAEF